MLVLTIVSFSFGIAFVPNAVQAQVVYIPSIWVDPDGCEHWVMDEDAEGYMWPHVTRDGRPVCTDDYPINAVAGKHNSGDTILGDLI